jgi:hypothetical protein
MATYAVQSPPHAGAAVTLTAPGGTTGDLAATGNGIGLLVSTGTAGTTVSLPIAPSYDGLTVATRTVVVAPSSLELIPLPSQVYGVGLTSVNYSTTTTVTVAEITIP